MGYSHTDYNLYARMNKIEDIILVGHIDTSGINQVIFKKE